MREGYLFRVDAFDRADADAYSGIDLVLSEEVGPKENGSFEHFVERFAEALPAVASEDFEVLPESGVLCRSFEFGVEIRAVFR